MINRGKLLTAMAAVLGFGALVDLLKAFTVPPSASHAPIDSKMPPVGIVVLGARHTGSDGTILGLLLATFLFFYSLGIWRMKRYALILGWIYVLFVIFNVSLFTIRNPLPRTPAGLVFAIAYLIGAVIFSVGTASLLTHRSLDLR